MAETTQPQYLQQLFALHEFYAFSTNAENFVTMGTKTREGSPVSSFLRPWPSHGAWMIPITLRLKQNSASPPIEIKLDSGQTRALQLRRKIPRLTLYLHVTFIF